MLFNEVIIYMNKEKRNQYIILSIIIILLILVIIASIFFALRTKEEKQDLLDIKINQIYSSDYTLKGMDKYVIGYYESNKLNVIIDEQGQEIYKDNEIDYDNIYNTKDGNYILYNNKDNNLNVYIFDNKSIKLLFQVPNIDNIKPIIYKNSYQEYITGFTTIKNNETNIYSITDSNPLVLKDIVLVPDYVDDNNYYVNSDSYLIVKNNEELMGVIDYKGKKVIDFMYKDIINTYNNSFVVKDETDCYGIVSVNNETLVDLKYKVIDIYENYYLIVNNKNKMALYDKEYNQLVGFKMDYDTLIDYNNRSDFNSIKLYISGGKIFIVNNYMEDINKTEFDKHNLYVINNNEIISKVNEIGFNIHNFIYYYDVEYNISIFDSDFNQIVNYKLEDVSKIEDISYVSDNILKIKYIDSNNQNKTIYIDNNGNKTSFDLGNLVINQADYVGYLKKQEDKYELTIYDKNYNILSYIDGQKIKIYKDFIIVDKGIYNIIKN